MHTSLVAPSLCFWTAFWAGTGGSATEPSESVPASRNMAYGLLLLDGEPLHECHPASRVVGYTLIDSDVHGPARPLRAAIDLVRVALQRGRSLLDSP